MVILTRVNVGGVNNFVAGPLYGLTLLGNQVASSGHSIPKEFQFTIPVLGNRATSNSVIPFALFLQNSSCVVVADQSSESSPLFFQNSRRTPSVTLRPPPKLILLSPQKHIHTSYRVVQLNLTLEIEVFYI